LKVNLQAREILANFCSSVSACQSRDSFSCLTQIVVHLADLDAAVAGSGIFLPIHEAIAKCAPAALSFFCGIAPFSAYTQNAIACTGILAGVASLCFAAPPPTSRLSPLPSSAPSPVIRIRVHWKIWERRTSRHFSG
jgi:hypothetical protein